jgi:hypothetical protein
LTTVEREVTLKPEQLVGLLGDHFRKKRKSWKRGMKIYASDLGAEGCRLEFFRKLRDFPSREHKPGELLMFAQGENLEEQVADAIAEVLTGSYEWVIVDKQTSIEYLGITGRLDILLRNVKDGNLLVLEVKTKRGAAFKFLDEPKRPNIIQTRFYMAGANAAYGLLAYVDREGQNFIRIFTVERNDESVEAEIEACQSLLLDENQPEPLELELDRRRNKGDDSFAFNIPWQVQWCNQAECPCSKKIGKVQTGVVAKGKKDDDGNITNIYPVKGCEEYLDLVRTMAEKAGYYGPE